MKLYLSVFVYSILLGLFSPAVFSAPANVIVVAKNGGDTASLEEAFAMTYAASASNKIVIDIAPGSYFLERPVTVRPHVHIQGKGSHLSSIVGRSGDLHAPLMVFSPDSSIKDLKIVNKASPYVTTIEVRAARFTRSAFRIENAEIVAQVDDDGVDSGMLSGGAIGISAYHAKINITNSVIKAFSFLFASEGYGSFATGISQIINDVMIKNTLISTVASTASGIALSDIAGASKVTIESSKIIVKSEQERAFGVLADTGNTILLDDSLVNASSNAVGAPAVGIEVYISEPRNIGRTTIKNSVVFGETTGIVQSKNHLSIKRSSLVNGVDSSEDEVTTSCLLADNGKGVLLNSACELEVD